MTRVFVPRDAAALAVGADEVTAALEDHADIIRTGSRGLFWLEPMIEVETPEGPMARSRPPIFQRCWLTVCSTAPRNTCVWAHPTRYRSSPARPA